MNNAKNAVIVRNDGIKIALAIMSMDIMVVTFCHIGVNILKQSGRVQKLNRGEKKVVCLRVVR
jgi:hypothetical protein